MCIYWNRLDIFLCMCIVTYVYVHMYSRWVNTLGTAALQGIDVVLRHSFFDYGYTHLVDQHFNPLPVSLQFLWFNNDRNG